MVSDEVLKGGGKQSQGLLQLDPPLCEALLVEGVAFDQVASQGVGGLDAELGAPLGLDPIADRDDHIEVVDRSRPSALVRGSMQNLHRTLLG